MDRYGRRFLLMTSATGLSVCYILASILLSRGTKSAAYGATAMVFIFQIFLGIGYLPIVSALIIDQSETSALTKTLFLSSHGSIPQRYLLLFPKSPDYYWTE